MASVCPAIPESPADEVHTISGDTRRGGPNAKGVVSVHRADRIVTITHQYDREYGYGGGLNFPPPPYLSLCAFSSFCSGIPWESLRVGGYDVCLFGIAVDDAADRRCVAWFKGLGCRVWSRGNQL